MISSDRFGRELKVKYGVRGAVSELDATAPLTNGEYVLLAGAARVYWPGHLPRPLLVRLTSSRLVTLAHYAFSPDRALELPRASITNITFMGDRIAVTWQRTASMTSVLRFQPFTMNRGASPYQPLPEMSMVAQELREWLASD